jgi:hypothetical protein
MIGQGKTDDPYWEVGGESREWKRKNTKREEP